MPASDATKAHVLSLLNPTGVASTKFSSSGGGGGGGIRRAAKKAKRKEKVKAYVEALREQEEGGGGGGLMGTLMNPVSKTLTALDYPRRAVMWAGAAGAVEAREAMGMDAGFARKMRDGAFSGESTGADLLERAGVDTPNLPLVGDTGGLAVDIITDPLTYAAGAGILRGGASRVAKNLATEGVERRTGQIVAKAAAQRGHGAADAGLERITQRAAEKMARKEIDPLVAQVQRDGVSSLEKSQLVRYLDTTGGARMIVPGTGRIGRKVTRAKAEQTIPIIPKAVTDLVNRPAAKARTALRESPVGRGISHRLGGEEKKQALRALALSGDPELAGVGRRGQEVLQTENSRAAATFRGLLDDYAKNVRPKLKHKFDDVVRAVEAGDVTDEGAVALRDFFARVRETAEKAGINLPDDPLYAPLLMTREGRKARTEALGRGARGGFNPTKKSRLRALFGSDQARIEFEQYAKERFGLAGDFFEKHPDKIIPTYLQALERRFAEELVKRRLADEGILTTALKTTTEISEKQVRKAGDLRRLLDQTIRRTDDARTRADAVAADQVAAQNKVLATAGSPVGGPAAASNPAEDIASLLGDATVARQAVSGVAHAPFESMGVRQLRRMAKDQGIKGADRAPKHELVDALATRAVAGRLAPRTAAALPLDLTKADAPDIIEHFPQLAAPSQRQAVLDHLDDGTIDPELGAAAQELESLLGTRSAAHMVRPALDVDALDREINLALRDQAAADEALARAVNKPDTLIEREVARQNKERVRYLAAARKEANAELRKVAVLEARRAQAEAKWLRESARADRLDEKLSGLRLESTRTQVAEEMLRGTHKLIDNYSNLMGRKELVDALNATAKVSTSEGWAQVLHHYDTVLNYIKAWQISTPGFHVRNTIGGVFNNFLGDIDPGSYNRYWRARLGLFSNEQDRAAFAAWREFSSPGQFGTHEVATGLRHESLLTRIKPWSSKNAYVHANQTVGAQVEDMLRGAMFMDVWKKTNGDADAALDAVFKYHFNYDDLSVFEQRGVRRVFPFYTWTRKNLPLQIEMMIARPGKYAWWNHYQRSVAEEGDYEGTVPSYYSDMWAIPTGMRDTNDDQMYLTPDLPFTRTLSEQIPLHDGKLTANNLLSQMTPIIKTPLERIQQHQYFKELPLTDEPTDFPDAWAKIPGFEGALRELGVVDRKGQIASDDAYTVEQFVPVLARLRRIFASEQKYQDRSTSTFMSFLGIPLRANTDAEKRAERYRRYLEKTDPLTIRVPKKNNR
jgi:uncharacterized protein YnzC (UPF0291/DUF896 family)